MGDGFKAHLDEVHGIAKTIGDLDGPIHDEAIKLGTPEVATGDFGHKYGDQGAAFDTGNKTLVTSVQKFGDAASNFGQKLESSYKAYVEQEEATTRSFGGA